MCVNDLWPFFKMRIMIFSLFFCWYIHIYIYHCWSILLSWDVVFHILVGTCSTDFFSSCYFHTLFAINEKMFVPSNYSSEEFVFELLIPVWFKPWFSVTKIYHAKNPCANRYVPPIMSEHHLTCQMFRTVPD